MDSLSLPQVMVADLHILVDRAIGNLLKIIAVFDG